MKGGFGIKRLIFLFLVLLLAYLTLYTWNLKSGVLDELAGNTGLEFTGVVLAPGKWVHRESLALWDRYVHLVGVEGENERLKDRVDELVLENVRLRESKERVERLERLLRFRPPPRWESLGARVIAHKLGPVGSLETMLVDRGSAERADLDQPAITPTGVVGRVLRTAPHFSTLLLLSDPNSRVAVAGRKSRTTGILVGQGPGEPLRVRYVPLNEPLAEGEVLVTSGLADIYPKGLPVARVTGIRRSDISLFQDVSAEPVVDLRDLEEVLLLLRLPPEVAGVGSANATAPGNATAGGEALLPAADGG
ncbi:rod shape-determining protein MreC [Desulfohalovibrio reitneri]|uniref:rod shape-determining protein MreC n=1 Tax=Desulfohalovibrio reitneri TaxID=1307759 RepID=UPI00068B1486|nr:rod shape-determining protein MreC [Desulfohalovibrio reitneri]